MYSILEEIMKVFKRSVIMAIILSAALFAVFTVINAQTKTKAEEEAALNENIKKDSQSLDKEIALFSNKISEVIKKYKLSEAEGVQLLPFRMEYDMTKEFIYMQKHSLIKSERYGDVIGIKIKSMKIYTGGGGVSKIETEVSERNFSKNSSEKIIIVDSSPTSEGADDIVMTHIVNGEEIVKDRKLGDINNTAAHPVANTIKREFYVPNLTYFYYSILSIAETYVKGRKDTDSIMTDFLKDGVDI